MKTGVLAKVNEESIEVVSKILKILRKRGIEVLLEDKLASALGEEGYSMEFIDKNSDVFIIVGGDGTLLRSVFNLKSAVDKPIIGVRTRDSLGFLMSIYDTSRLESYLDMFMKGSYTLQQITRLRLKFKDVNVNLLNDLLIRSSQSHKLLYLTAVDLDTGETILSGGMDGVLIATTVGSTAHSLSLGGPVLDPRLKAFILHPIAPLSYLNRPIILPSDFRICLNNFSDDIKLVGDGFYTAELSKDESIEISSGEDVKIVKFRNDFYRKLRARLIWTG